MAVPTIPPVAAFEGAGLDSGSQGAFRLSLRAVTVGAVKGLSTGR